MNYSIGERVRFRQVPHDVPLASSNQSIAIHEAPKSGTGQIQFASRIHNEWHLFVLPDDEAKKQNKMTVLLRVPPDIADKE